MNVLVQNLEKKPGLATQLVDRFQPDVVLAQEISCTTEAASFLQHSVHHTSSWGYGTAIYSRVGNMTNVRRVLSPHSETGGFIHKKTIVADCNGIEFVSFHGYNGQPFKNISGLLDHVNAVIAVLANDGPAVFAGDFNTWSSKHLESISAPLASAGFELACSWPYPGRIFPLDHVFVRQIHLKSFIVYQCESDHQGAQLEFQTVN